MEIPRVVKVEYLSGYRVQLWFADGFEGVVDLEKELWGPMFEPLREVEQFRRVFVAYGTICWPNGADLAPELLREQAVPSRHAA